MPSKGRTAAIEVLGEDLPLSVARCPRRKALCEGAKRLPSNGQSGLPQPPVCLEISIEHRLGRLPLPLPPAFYVASRRDWLWLGTLPFDESSAGCEAGLPLLHRDPFHRGLVSQAAAHGLTIVAPDSDIKAHPVPEIS